MIPAVIMNRKKRLAMLEIVVLLLVAVSCGSTSSAPTSTGPTVVAGRVFDSQTGIGVSGATVIFRDTLSAGPAISSSVTDGTGSYQTSILVGRYAVSVDNVYGGQAHVRSGINRTDLLVHSGACIVRYGTVADASTGRPVPGALLSMLGVTATTDVDGWYRFDLGCGLHFSNTIDMGIMRAGYVDAALPMGRGENLAGAVRADADLVPR
jgi:hypothetical protein